MINTLKSLLAWCVWIVVLPMWIVGGLLVALGELIVEIFDRWLKGE